MALEVGSKLPSELYEEHVLALRNQLFGRYARRNTTSQNRNGGRLSESTVEQIRKEGSASLRELREKFAEVL